ncbi:hypothetical protein [uncultured Pseudomonas sp.]|uniref:hypothetical protein n=1 Tax=uncultured Pseudomonas sp. TaxID=114707 RepID=UPI002630241E|nr:hypothetical protein [uncultured Pseudomonas sp.]
MAENATAKPKRKRPPRTAKIREQDRLRQQAAEERKRQRAKELGARMLKGEIYGATSEKLAAMRDATETEEMEFISNAIHRLFELRSRDPVAFAALTDHNPLPEVWHG